MNPSVYLETSVISYLTSRPHQDVTIHGHQITTKFWWSTAIQRFDLFVSQLVVRECSGGDPEAAKDRLDSIANIPVLPITLDAESLADALIQGHATPSNQPRDALHCILPWLLLMEYNTLYRGISDTS